MLSRSSSIAAVLVALSLSGCVVVVKQTDSSVKEDAAARLKSAKMQVPVPKQRRILYVDPQRGADKANAGATEATPLRTITYALEQASAGTEIQLAPGKYTVEGGETFPLKLKPGVILKGNEAKRGEGVAIAGGGYYISRTWARQSVTILAALDTKILGVTISNPNIRGTGVWVESTNPTIANCSFINSHREGVFVTGTGTPKIENNLFAKNGGNGISLTHQAGGEIRGNIIENTGFGLAIGGSATPKVVDNQILSNVDGVVVTQSARPVLRGNAIASNRRDGLVAITEAQPDLGTAKAPGNNVFKSNGRYDVQNAAEKHKLVAVGNQLKGDRVVGEIEMQASSADNRRVSK